MKKAISFCCSIILYCVVSFTFIACTDDEMVIGKRYDTLTNSDGVEFTFASYYMYNTRLDIGLYDNTTVVGISVIVTNNSNKERSFDADSVYLYDSKGVQYKTRNSFVYDYAPHDYGPHVGGYALYDVFENIDIGVSGLLCAEFNLPIKTNDEKYTIKIGYNSKTKSNERVVFVFSQADDSKTTDDN